MNTYVNRENACKMFNRYFHDLNGNPTQVLVSDIKQAFLELPTTEIAEIKHGKWLGVHCTGQYDDWKCSCCGNFEDTRNRNNCGNYCKWCGAKMDLEGDDTNV